MQFLIFKNINSCIKVIMVNCNNFLFFEIITLDIILIYLFVVGNLMLNKQKNRLLPYLLAYLLNN